MSSNLALLLSLFTYLSPVRPSFLHLPTIRGQDESRVNKAPTYTQKNRAEMGVTFWSVLSFVRCEYGALFGTLRRAGDGSGHSDACSGKILTVDEICVT